MTPEDINWTIDPKTGRSNSSPEYLRICAEVERIIRADGATLINGGVASTAALIVAQLAHVHNMAPVPKPRMDPMRKPSTTKLSKNWID